MKPHFLAGATVAVMTMTAIPAWATCDQTASVDKPDSAVASESNADTEMNGDKGDLLAEEAAVENLDERAATEGSEDPAPEGYSTSVPADQIADDADVGETTPATSGEETVDQAQGTPASTEEEAPSMKTEVSDDGEYVEKQPEDEQIAMASAEEATAKAAALTEETTVGEGGKIEAATGGAEPEENWFGCNPDADSSEGDTCEESQVEATRDAESDPPEQDVEIEARAGNESVNLDDDCEDADKG